MAQRTLGLDIGSNSVGWALVDEGNGALVAAGVRVFPEGVDRDTSGAEHPKNEQRRIARGMRRQIARRARRKRALRFALVQAGLLPADRGDQAALDSLDPYELRRRAVVERLEPFEIGRVLVHLNQRRGFLSNRKADRSKAKKNKENSETLAEISALAEQLDGQTLGEHFASARSAAPLERIRGVHTHREMYRDEFRRIWEKQREFHPELLTDAVRYGRRGELSYPREPETLRQRKSNSLLAEYGLYGIMFFQRAMYWPASVVGRCEYEPKQKRCPRSDRVAQRFRLLQEVNNLRVIPQRGLPRPLSPEEKQKALKWLESKKESTFDDLRKKLGLLEEDGFNLEIGDRRKLHGMPVDATLSRKDLFGPAWHKRPDGERTSIVRSLIDDDESTIRQRATTEWGCSEEIAEKLIDIDLGDGYASLSRMAIEKLLPHLERGLPLMSHDGSPSALSEAKYLRPDQRVVNEQALLPTVSEEITNPLVRQALFEVRKVVNAIIREHGKPTAIHIELAREVQGNAIQRAKHTQRIRERERRRDEAAEFIRERGLKATRDAIDRYLLWKEQGEVCIYSGRPISPQQLFGGEVDVDHILPYSRSLDNSLMNRVVAFRSENTLKENRTPHEWLAEVDPRKYEAILQRAAKLPYDVRNSKRQKFQQESIELDHFVARQLTDTAYITRKVREYVQCLGCDVVCSKGQLTAQLRHMWGLNTVLREDEQNLKNREDHRHHAVDAVVIALTNRSRLQQLARVRFGDETLPYPWQEFRNDVRRAVQLMQVSHKPRRRIAGGLHEDTIYGQTEKADEFVRRKSVTSLDNTKQLAKIRDATIRQLVRDHVARHVVDVDRPGVIPKSVWVEIPRMPSGIPIRRVRMIENSTQMKEIRPGQFAEPGANHHMEILEVLNDDGTAVVQRNGMPRRVGVLGNRSRPGE